MASTAIPHRGTNWYLLGCGGDFSEPARAAISVIAQSPNAWFLSPVRLLATLGLGVALMPVETAEDDLVSDSGTKANGEGRVGVSARRAPETRTRLNHHRCRR